MAQTQTPSIGVGLIGCGTVGAGVVALLDKQAALYTHRLGRPLQLRRVLVRDTTKYQAHPGLPQGALTADPDRFFATHDMPIVVEVAGGGGAVAQHVSRALSMGKHVVTANKAMLAQQGPQLFALARQHQASIAFEASCGGGIPILTALEFGLMANRIDALYGILNGTANFILTAMTQHGQTYDHALRDAQDKGFAEADPTMDVSGRDAAQKLSILASLAFGVRCQDDEVVCEGIDNLDLTDLRFGAELGYGIKLLAIAQRCGEPGGGSDAAISLRTHPCFIPAGAPLAQVHGAYNALSVYGHAVGHTMYYGPGAGSLPTASAVVSDLLNTASGWYPAAFSSLRLWPDQHQRARVVEPTELASRFYLRFNAMDKPGVLAKLSAILGDAGISISAVLQHEYNAGAFVPMVIVTHRAPEGAVAGALEEIQQLEVIQGQPVRIRIVDLPADEANPG